MNVIDKNKVLDVLNNLQIVEEGSEGYILVENNSEVHEKLNALGVSSEIINKYGDDETFCIIALAFTEGYANDFVDGKLVSLVKSEMWLVYDSCEGVLYNGGDEIEAKKAYDKMRVHIAALAEDDLGDPGDTLVLAKVVQDCTLESTGEKNYIGDEFLKWNDYEYQK